MTQEYLPVMIQADQILQMSEKDTSVFPFLSPVALDIPLSIDRSPLAHFTSHLKYLPR